MLSRGKAHATAIRKGATLQPVRVGPVVLHEYVYSVGTLPDVPKYEFALANVSYRECVLWRLAGESEWLVMDGRLGAARLFRRRSKR